VLVLVLLSASLPGHAMHRILQTNFDETSSHWRSHFKSDLNFPAAASNPYKSRQTWW
jgi:hypothetical protein